MFKVRVGRVTSAVAVSLAGLLGAFALPGSASADLPIQPNGTHLPVCRNVNTGFFCLYEAAYMNSDLKKWRFKAVDECQNVDLPSGFWDVVSSWTHHQTGPNPTVPVISWRHLPDYEPLWTMSGQLESDYVGNQANDKADHYDNTHGC
ncbi:hypothetical protein AB0M43_37290 [Longispora sp. NPDC051575]|uniref:hypothetical protein n=1 Tax=Longispora sp. NPDC051575 TaxID=3154943 RepID=UPI0034267E5A